MASLAMLPGSRRWTHRAGPLSLLAALLMLGGGCGGATGGAGDVAAPSSIRPGLEVLIDEPPAEVRGRRVGLITNHTGIDSRGVSGIDRLAAEDAFDLVALFAPEHGIRGAAEAGERIESERDERSGLPIHSLYGATRKPTPRMLEGVDALLFDMQDVGVRQYTYASTMALGMQAAAEKGIPFVVLDRPNPVGGVIVEGGVLDSAFASFVGMYPVASRHGLTLGELARLLNDRFGIGADLVVVPVEGWRRGRWFDETGLPWVNPSPNIRSLEAATHYPGTVLIEGTNLSEGRGTERPFEQVGAPWLDAAEVARRMNALGLPGVSFEAVHFAIDPSAGKHPGLTVPGVRLRATDRESYRPVETVVRMIALIRELHPGDFAWTATMDRLSGSGELRRAVEAGEVEALLRSWREQAAGFEALRRPYLLYP